MQPPAEHVHWLFATGFLLLGLCLLARASRQSASSRKPVANSQWTCSAGGCISAPSSDAV